jgi:thiosulfate/3-mercaptopyruvate sulfurtransferase
MRPLRLFAAVLALFLAGCVMILRDPPEPKVNADLLVSTEQLAGMLEEPGLVILHVARDPADYQTGHIPGARFVRLGDLVVERDGIPNELPEVDHLRGVFEAAGVSNDSRVVIYGDLGGLAAGRTFFTLDYLGHERAALLDGGIETWRREQRPVSTAASEVTRGTFVPAPRPELVVTADWVNERLQDTTVVLVDARPVAEYRGEEAGGGVPRPGRIPGANNLFWRNALRDAEHPVLRVPEVLHAMFRGAGARTGNTVVTYCRTGVQASHAYFVSRYLGYETRLYDGSYIEWSNRADLPVEN